MGRVGVIKIPKGLFIPLVGQFTLLLPLFIVSTVRIHTAINYGKNYEGLFWISIIDVIAIVILFSTKRFLEINGQAKTIREYVLFLGFQIGSTKRYEKVEKIFINRVKLRTKNDYLSPFKFSMASLEYKETLYKSFLKISNGDKMEFISDSQKERLIERLMKYKIKLDTVIHDNTSGTSRII